ncbi:MAG: phosphodiester glycosidase family protein, partial [Polyangiaceae bacterium]|nr:phosphodiester glycosidase family protein [Polyangiaceae bacterium]
FAMAPVGSVHPNWAARGDGVWVPMLDEQHPEDAPRLFKTLLHPDKSRSWAELFVVAIDLRQVAVLPVMGYQEPRTEKKEAEGYTRFAKIPPRHFPELLAAFNGGFMAEHGHYGVFFDGISFIDAKPHSCTFARFKDGHFAVAKWEDLEDQADELLWYRQAPECMYRNGKIHPWIDAHRSRKWGATLDGNTVIRRSAVGLSEDGQVLFVGISNHTNAKALAEGMNHAGAHNVAQMDVNWSYPKFVTYKADEEGTPHPIALAKGFEFSDKLYVGERSMRDFFYLARKEAIDITEP